MAKTNALTKGYAAQGSKSPWVVKKFDPTTLLGEVAQVAGGSFVFHSTSFSSDTGLRFPYPGEAVEVATTPDGELLRVHGK